VVSRRAIVVGGCLVVAAYAGLAFVSSRLSPLARGPLLDGLGPAAPYRWVNPPPALAAENQPPSGGRFDVALSNAGSEAATFVLSDNQMTLIVPEGTFASASGQFQVRLTVRPVDPATLGAPPGGLLSFGNAYRLRATYVPSGAPVAGLAGPIEAFLIYPVTPDLTSADHRVATSPDGRTWTVQEGADSHALQQAEGPVPDLGYVQVVGALGVPTAAGGGGGSTTLATGLIVAAVCVGLVGLGLVLRGRDPGRGPGGRRSGRRGP
jgi:hypothetical protein